MAKCVISSIVDTDLDRVVPACVVHAAYAPCPYNGQPACRTPLHTDDHLSRDAAVEFWELRTGRQRPLVLHRGRLDVGDHQTDGDGVSCWCGPEVLGGDGRG